MQQEKLQYLLHYNNIWSKHFQEKKLRKSLRDIIAYHFLF